MASVSKLRSTSLTHSASSKMFVKMFVKRALDAFLKTHLKSLTDKPEHEHFIECLYLRIETRTLSLI